MQYTEIMETATPKDTASSPFVSPGMPALDMSGRSFSFFEFWPSWLIYLPVVIQSLAQGIFHRSITLPLLANPALTLGGMVGAPKSELLEQAQGKCKEAILDWFMHTLDTQNFEDQITAIKKQMIKRQIDFPAVCKPDIGCRGNGVRLIHDEAELTDYLEAYPENANIMIQKLANWEPEAGVFFVREPGQDQGRIISLALKYMPYVVGNGRLTLEQLINEDARARHLKHLYAGRHRDSLDKVIPAGTPYRLIFSASHCKGAIFRNGEKYITAALNEKVNALMQDIPEFYYGRLDIKFRNLVTLQQGDDFEIIEINAASSESLHIWDRNTSLKQAVGALLGQYRQLFRLGAMNRKRGYSPPGLLALLKGWQLERNLSRAYPSTD
jgi:hypothetical protein